MIKDRLKDLQQATQQENQNDQKNHIGNSPRNPTQDIKNVYERSEVLKQWIESVENNVEEIIRILRQLDDLQYNQKDVKDKLDSLFQNNISISQQITRKLKDFQKELKDSEEQGASGRIVKIQYDSLKTRYQKAFTSHSKQLENYKKIQKENIRKQLIVKGNVNITEEELNNIIEEGKDIQVFTENIIVETAEARRMLADLEERHDRLLKIEQMIREVRDLFLEMAFLVDTQQELVDRVEFQARQALDYIESGVVDLEKSRQRRKRYLKKRVWCYVCLAIVIVVIILALYFSFKK